ncbi:MAG: lycopene cyclase family protein [Ilumatobacteraceae bacterium]
MTLRQVDIAIVGDGPAGSVLAHACRERDVDVVLVGRDEEWSATYGTWVDEVPDRFRGALGTVIPSIRVHAVVDQALDRPYGVFDNVVLRSTLRNEVDHVIGSVGSISGASGRQLLTIDGDEIQARVVVDATGWPPSFASTSTRRPMAWQTAFGIVLREPPDGDTGQPTLMDFRPVGGGGTFCYSIPVHDGWLVEETILASSVAANPADLVPRLAARLGMTADDVMASAIRTEQVAIPMGVPLPDRNDQIVAFGAAGGMIHPATGFSVTASMRAASRVAEALDAGLEPAAIHEAVWPSSLRRSRILQDYGLRMLLDLDATQVAEFFATFFRLDVDRWAPYMRIDAAPSEVTRAMTAVFRTASWPTRRRLMTAGPAGLRRLLRP